MAKFAILAFVLVAVAIVQAFPATDTEISAAASKGDWDLVHKLISQQFHNDKIWQPSVSAGSVRSLTRPPGGGHIFGKSEYTFHTTSDVNGKKVENSGGHRIINRDGKIEEYDFTP